jgi:DNA-binding response OmpR family regulator
MVGEETTVLIVDDDPVTVDRFGSWLDDDYEVRTALDGETALTAAGEADIVLLDRKLPDRSGREVASRIFELDDRPVVAMVSDVTPDVDIVDLPCDDYLVKPLTAPDLRNGVGRYARRATYEDALAEYTTLASKRATLESNRPIDELVADPQYDELCERCESLRRQLDGLVAGFEQEDFETAFHAPEFSAN